jgi:SRSO17 transposase
LGVVAARGEGADAAFVHAGTGSVTAGSFLDGLLGAERRKTGWMRAEAAGDPGPWRQQAILGRGQWDADALRDIVRAYVLETLADSDAVVFAAQGAQVRSGKSSNSCSISPE